MVSFGAEISCVLPKMENKKGCWLMICTCPKLFTLTLQCWKLNFQCQILTLHYDLCWKKSTYCITISTVMYRCRVFTNRVLHINTIIMITYLSSHINNTKTCSTGSSLDGLSKLSLRNKWLCSLNKSYHGRQTTVFNSGNLILNNSDKVHFRRIQELETLSSRKSFA